MNTEDLAVRNDRLTLELLERFPVWAPHEGDDSEIIRPVIESDPFATDHDPLTIKADFETKNHRALVGCVVFGRTCERVYLIEVCMEGRWFGFHKSLPDLFECDLKNLASAMGEAEGTIFPIRYQTNVVGPNGKLVEGIFSLEGPESR